MQVEIVLGDEQDKIKDYDFNEEKIKNITVCCLESEGITFACEIGVTFTDNEQIRVLNNEHRNIDRETDVLSFPMIDDINNIADYEINQDGSGVLLGDIVISLEKAASQAEEYGHSFEREVAFLIVHSMMHLLGYDHMEEDERIVMREHEEAVLSKLGILR